jgi:hypothetical protein
VGAILALLDMPAEGRRAAALDGRHDLELAEAYMAGVGSAPCRRMTAENIRDLQNWTRHKSRALRGRCTRLALADELIERARDLPDRLGGHLGVERLSMSVGLSDITSDARKPAPYSRGASRHRNPFLMTKTIPLITRRSSTQGTP